MQRFSGFWLCILVLFLAVPVSAADWNQWRGANRDGVVETEMPETWPESLDRKWSVEIGTGHASPILIGNTIYQHSRLNDLETVSALNVETGDVIWRDAYKASYDMPNAAYSHGQGPKSTPLFADGAVYTLGISGVFSSYDAQSGKLRWRHDFVGEFPKPYPLFGTAMSPMSVDGSIIAHVGGQEGGELSAFDPKTGKRVWSWSSDGPSYASPIVTQINEVRHLITQSEHNIISLDPTTGTLLWQIPYTTAYDQNIVTAAMDGDWVITSGLGNGVSAYHPVLKSNAWSPDRIWHNPDFSFYMASPVLHSGHIFGFSHHKKGQFFRLNGDTGASVWASEGRQTENASVVAAGDWLLWLTTEGRLFVTRADADTFEPEATYSVSDSPVWAHLVVTDRGFLVKDANTLSLWNIPE